MKFYTSPSFNNLPLTDVQTYDQDSINALFENLTPQELAQYSSLILDGSISSAKLWSSYKVNEAIKQAVIEANEYSSDLFSKSSTFSIEYITGSLPTTDIKTNVIYILETTDASSNVIHTINFYNETTSSWVTASTLESALSNVYSKDEIDTILQSYPTKSESLTQDDVLTAISDTPSNDKVLSEKATKDLIDNASVKISAEADNQIEEKTDGIYVAPEQEEISWADYQALSEEEKNNGKTYFIPDLPVSSNGEVIGEVEYGSFFANDISGDLLSAGSVIDFSNKTRGNLTYDNGVKLTKGKLYLINCNVACVSATNATNSHIRFDIRINGNQIYVTNGISIPSGSTSKWSNSELVTHYECKNDGEVLTVNVVGVENINTILGGISHLIITEVPSYQGLIDVSDQHIKGVVSNNITDVPTTTITSFTSSTITGNLYYRVANGICYVSVCPLQNTAIATDIDVCQLPKPIFPLNSNLASNTNGNNIGILWMNPDTTLKARFFVANTVGYTTFSYPVASN